MSSHLFEHHQRGKLQKVTSGSRFPLRAVSRLCPCESEKHFFIHDEFTVFKATQARPLYLIELGPVPPDDKVTPSARGPTCSRCGSKDKEMKDRTVSIVNGMTNKMTDKESDGLLGLRQTLGTPSGPLSW